MALLAGGEEEDPLRQRRHRGPGARSGQGLQRPGFGQLDPDHESQPANVGDAVHPGQGLP